MNQSSPASIRSLIQRAAAIDGRAISHLSFKAVSDHVTASHESFRFHPAHPRKRAEALSRLLETCAAKRIDIRPFRSELWAVERRPQSYLFLTNY